LLGCSVDGVVDCAAPAACELPESSAGDVEAAVSCVDEDEK
jgi:hypothetical protein